MALCLTVCGAAAAIHLLVLAASAKGWMVIASCAVFFLGILWIYSSAPSQTKVNSYAARS